MAGLLADNDLAVIHALSGSRTAQVLSNALTIDRNPGHRPDAHAVCALPFWWIPDRQVIGLFLSPGRSGTSGRLWPYSRPSRVSAGRTQSWGQGVN